MKITGVYWDDNYFMKHTEELVKVVIKRIFIRRNEWLTFVCLMAF